MRNLAERFTFDCPLNATNENRGTPERNLLMALLERTILDFVGNDEKAVESAEEWVFADLEDPDSHKQAYSFIWTCNELDLDPGMIAQAIESMPKRGNSRVAPWYSEKKAA